jgi:hypothetical protein
MAKKWSALTRREKGIAVLVSVFAVFVIGSFANAVGQPDSAPTPEAPITQESQAIITYSEKTETEAVPFKKLTKEDATLAEGTESVTTKGVNGVLTKTYKITLTDGIETGRELIKQEETKKPVNQVTTVGTYVAPVEAEPSNCDPNYSGCVPIASDVDCGGGSGDGPAYQYGSVNVIGSDIYDLDRDNDGLGCE